jgi:hypothetical protein
MCFWFALIILLILAVGTTPAWPYSREWGYYPSGGLFLLLILLLIIWWLAWIPWWGTYWWWR